MVFGLCLFGVQQGWSADFHKGSTAAKRGDLATTLQEWKPLADKGKAVFQFNLSAMYANGTGLLHDKVYAHMWGGVVANNENENGRKTRDFIAK